MKLQDLKPAPGSRRERTRVGRGYGSGHVKTAGRGTKGQRSRSGGNVPPRFQGGQLPIIQQLPEKRGFTNIFRREFAIVNLQTLADRFEADSEVSPETLVETGVLRSTKLPVKILANGEIDRALKVKAHHFSAAAKAKIEAAGGTVEELK